MVKVNSLSYLQMDHGSTLWGGWKFSYSFESRDRCPCNDWDKEGHTLVSSTGSANVWSTLKIPVFTHDLHNSHLSLNVAAFSAELSIVAIFSWSDFEFVEQVEFGKQVRKIWDSLCDMCASSCDFFSEWNLQNDFCNSRTLVSDLPLESHPISKRRFFAFFGSISPQRCMNQYKLRA